MSVGEAQQRISSSEFVEWVAFYGLEPFGGLKEDWRSGLVCSVLANVNRSKARTAYKPKDFMPNTDAPGATPANRQSPEQMQMMLRMHFPVVEQT